MTFQGSFTVRSITFPRCPIQVRGAIYYRRFSDFYKVDSLRGILRGAHYHTFASYGTTHCTSGGQKQFVKSTGGSTFVPLGVPMLLRMGVRRVRR